MPAVLADFSTASAVRSRSTVTNESPAFFASSSAGGEHLGQRLGEVELAVASLDLGQRLQRRLDAEARVARAPARALDQRGGEAFLVVEQHLQEMLGRELLVTGGKRRGLGRLDEAPDPLGIFLDVHEFRLRSRPARSRRRIDFQVTDPLGQ